MTEETKTEKPTVVAKHDLYNGFFAVERSDGTMQFRNKERRLRFTLQPDSVRRLKAICEGIRK